MISLESERGGERERKEASFYLCGVVIAHIHVYLTLTPLLTLDPSMKQLKNAPWSTDTFGCLPQSCSLFFSAYNTSILFKIHSSVAVTLVICTVSAGLA